MEGFAGGIGVLFLMALGFGLWALSSSWDRNRIAEYIKERGGRVVSVNWAPFGKGWFGEKEERIYEVVYYDREGNQHFATCKTSMWTGVFWTEDKVTHPKSKWFDSVSPENRPGNPVISQIPKVEADAADELLRLDELERLRKENARLRQQLEGQGGTADPEKCPACGAAVAPDAKRCPDCGIALE